MESADWKLTSAVPPGLDDDRALVPALKRRARFSASLRDSGRRVEAPTVETMGYYRWFLRDLDLFDAEPRAGHGISYHWNQMAAAVRIFARKWLKVREVQKVATKKGRKSAFARLCPLNERGRAGKLGEDGGWRTARIQRAVRLLKLAATLGGFLRLFPDIYAYFRRGVIAKTYHWFESAECLRTANARMENGEWRMENGE